MEHHFSAGEDPSEASYGRSLCHRGGGWEVSDQNWMVERQIRCSKRVYENNKASRNILFVHY